MLDTLKVTLDANENITPEVKENLMELITIFAETFKEIDLTNLNTRLKNLKLKIESKFLVRMPCRYNAFTNEILINEEMFKECDVRHWMMHCLVAVATGKDNRYGFTTTDNKMIALCEGYTEILTNYLVGDVDNNYFTDEIIMTNIIAKKIGVDNIYKAYFENNSDWLMGTIKKIGLEGIVLDVDRNFENTKTGGQRSEIGDLQLTALQQGANIDDVFSYKEYFPKDETINDKKLAELRLYSDNYYNNKPDKTEGRKMVA